MTLRTELVEMMKVVSEASRTSPLEVTGAGVKAFDFIAKRGNSLLASIDTMERLHRELYLTDRDDVTEPHNTCIDGK